MSLFGQFRSIADADKAQAIRRLLESSTPNFGYFYLLILASAMATLGLIADSAVVVIGSMLISPALFPILSLSLGIVVSDYRVLSRSLYTVVKSLAFAIAIAVVVTLLFLGGAEPNDQILSRTEPSLLYFFVAVAAGLAASFAIAKSEWNEVIPGIAISVALIPPLATVGISIAMLNVTLALGAFALFFINLIGIVVASMMSFSLMNLYEKRSVAQSTFKKTEEKTREEREAVEEFDEEERLRAGSHDATPQTPT